MDCKTNPNTKIRNFGTCKGLEEKKLVTQVQKQPLQRDNLQTIGPISIAANNKADTKGWKNDKNRAVFGWKNDKNRAVFGWKNDKNLFLSYCNIQKMSIFAVKNRTRNVETKN